MKVLINLQYDLWLVDLTGQELEAFVSVLERARKAERKYNAQLQDYDTYALDEKLRTKLDVEILPFDTKVQEQQVSAEPPAEVQP